MADYNSKLWRSITGSSPRTRVSIRREAEQVAQRQRNGELDMNGNRT